MRKPPRPCSKCGRPVSRAGLCSDHYRQADHRRGTAQQRGYNHTHATRFRAGVLARDPHCVLCGDPSTVADHYPHTRKALIAAGLDPNHPDYGRGLCETCHNRHTAATSIAQPLT